MEITKNTKPQIESLDGCEPDNCFIDGDVDVGIPIVSFRFGTKPAEPPQPMANTTNTAFTFNTKALKANTRDATPAIDVECFNIKRCYQYKQSTVRKLNELKTKHSDVNVYLSTIIDEAISYYYDYVFTRKPN